MLALLRLNRPTCWLEWCYLAHATEALYKAQLLLTWPRSAVQVKMSLSSRRASLLQSSVNSFGVNP